MGAVVAVGSVVWLVRDRQDMAVLQRLLLLNFILPIHPFEEFGWPGGFRSDRTSASPERDPRPLPAQVNHS